MFQLYYIIDEKTLKFVMYNLHTSGMKVHVFFVLLLLGCHRAENKNNNNNNNNDSASNDSDNVVSNLHASNGEAEEDHLDELIGTYLDSFDQRNKKRG